MPSGTRRELPWADITRQVRRATLAYMNSTFDSPRKYVAVKHVANYLCFLESPESIRYPHLCGQTYKTIAMRVTMSMNKMGWVEYSKGVYEMPGGTGMKREKEKQRWRVVKDTDTSRRQRVEPIGQLRLPVV